MSLNLLPCRGTVFKLGDGDESSFALSPGLTGSDESPIIMQSLNVSDQVVNLPVLTLNGIRVLYVYGKAWGDIAVGGLALLGKAGAGDALAKVTEYYESVNVSNEDGNSVKVSLPGNTGYKFYATGLSIGDPNPEYQFFPFSIQGKIIGL